MKLPSFHNNLDGNLHITLDTMTTDTQHSSFHVTWPIQCIHRIRLCQHTWLHPLLKGIHLMFLPICQQPIIYTIENLFVKVVIVEFAFQIYFVCW